MADDKTLSTSIVASFGEGDAGSNLNLTIENDPNMLRFGDLDIHLLLFPAVGATIRTNRGSVRTGGVRPINVNSGIVTFSGGNTSGLPKLPVYKFPELEVLFAFDLEGSPTNIGVSFVAGTPQLKSSKPCYAAVQYSPYITSALEIIYTPLAEVLQDGLRTTFGVIAAFYPPNNITVFQTQPFNGDFGADLIELYRITRKIVTNPEGEFEFPPAYPTDGRYTTPFRDLIIDTDSGIVTKRVHEIGFMDEKGFCSIQRPDIILYPPYDGINAVGYKPVLVCEVSALSKEKFSSSIISTAAKFVASRGLGCKDAK